MQRWFLFLEMIVIQRDNKDMFYTPKDDIKDMFYTYSKSWMITSCQGSPRAVDALCRGNIFLLNELETNIHLYFTFLEISLISPRRWSTPSTGRGVGYHGPIGGSLIDSPPLPQHLAQHPPLMAPLVEVSIIVLLFASAAAITIAACFSAKALQWR